MTPPADTEFYYLVCPKCRRVMSKWFTHCGAIFGPCQVRKEEGVWVRARRTQTHPTYGGAGRRYALTLDGALPYEALKNARDA